MLVAHEAAEAELDEGLAVSLQGPQSLVGRSGRRGSRALRPTDYSSLDTCETSSGPRCDVPVRC